MSDKDDLIYDEDDSVAFIQNYLPQELKGKFSNDDINYIVDLIYEFYESKGFLDENSDDNAEIDIDETREWLSKTRDVSSWDDEKIKTANTGTNVFVRASIQIQDAIEDLKFGIYIE